MGHSKAACPVLKITAEGLLPFRRKLQQELLDISRHCELHPLLDIGEEAWVPVEGHQESLDLLAPVELEVAVDVADEVAGSLPASKLGREVQIGGEAPDVLPQVPPSPGQDSSLGGGLRRHQREDAAKDGIRQLADPVMAVGVHGSHSSSG
ncbi:hypothetical protein Taro_016960 [Colocasia esculenta]|uniref:Uncharacterized protein n=1 Tax=Colocasia esculenta TaxID=4460 RepID=A0A843ULS8_COLES|nr:hypothetical protein [Colocasia esculenta]